MSMSHGRTFKTESGWRFGTVLEQTFYPFGYCRDCDGHPTPQDAQEHYRQFIADKQGAALANSRAGAGNAAGLPLPLGVLNAQPGQVTERACVECGTIYPLNTERSAAIQSYRCPACAEAAAAALDEQIALERRRKYQAMCDTLWVSCGVPANYQRGTVERFRVDGVAPSIRKAHAAAVAWAEGFDLGSAVGVRGLLLYGDVGTGKTHLAAGILRAVVERLVPTREAILARMQREREIVTAATGYDDNAAAQTFYTTDRFPVDRYSVEFAVWPELVNQLVEGRFHKDGQASEEEIYNRVIGRRLLVIDDVGRVTRPSQVDQQREIAYRIFNGRYNNRLPLIITTNKTPDDLGEIVGEAAADRMVEMFDVYPMSGESYRSRKRAERG